MCLAGGKQLGSVVKNPLIGFAYQEGSGDDPEFWTQRSNIAALLFQVIPVDGEFHDTERQCLLRILSDEFMIEEEDAVALVADVQSHARSASDLAVLTERLNLVLCHDEKLNLISHMWEMVFADGRLHEYELLLIERVAELLALNTDEVCSMMNFQKSGYATANPQNG